MLRVALHYTLNDARRAWQFRDPAVVDLVILIAQQPDPQPEQPIREGAPTFERFLEEIRSKGFRKKPLDVQRVERLERLKALEADDAEAPLPDRLRLHELILNLWKEDSPFARSCLIRIIEKVKLTYGPWRAIKRIYKEAEKKGDLEIFGAITVRLDQAHATNPAPISRLTMGYMVRRAWRYLRRIGQRLPVAYPDAASAVLAQYSDEVVSAYPGNVRTWVYNKILFGKLAQSGGRSVSFSGKRDPIKQRAFPEAWRRTPRPLFGLLERARSEPVREFAAHALRQDFRAELREVEPEWVARLIAVPSRVTHDFVIWILNNVPKFEQAGFRELRLHEPVLRLLDSPSNSARTYAAGYARVFARDLTVEKLVQLANNSAEDVRKLAADLLGERDPRKEIGLESWGKLLETRYGHTLAAQAIRKHFGSNELTPEWFADRLFSKNDEVFEFAQKLLEQLHPRNKLGAEYFQGLLDRLDTVEFEEEEDFYELTDYAVGQLGKLDPNQLNSDFLQRLFLLPEAGYDVTQWINEGRLKTEAISLDFLKALAYHPDWDAHPFIRGVRESKRTWAKFVRFDESRAEEVLGWLQDVRRFTPGVLGYEWLLKLVKRTEPHYHNFAVEVMIKGFIPADFATVEESAANVVLAEESAEAEGAVDFGGESFIFTGKMATMPRKEAEGKVREAGGSVASSVNTKLHYLVIGDEGSALYGQGKKGSKQVKAEQVNAEGGNIRIISETAFLRMLKGEQQQASADSTASGCENLWKMAIAGGAEDARLGQFARRYIKRHHPGIALDETDRPVDPGAEIPAEFLTFERFEPLFLETREPLRSFALTIAKYEFGRWQPAGQSLVKLAEAPHSEVRRFVADALLADDAPEHRGYRIDQDALTPESVYRFCESADDEVRALGMKLIDRSPRLQVPDQLYYLAESPDRMVRAFVIRAIWSLYRDRGITKDWKPSSLPQPTVGATARKKAIARQQSQGTGPPARPVAPPATPTSLADLLRRILFELPPGPPPRRRSAAQPNSENDLATPAFQRLQPLSNRKAKLAVVETLRDLALEESEFARYALPPIVEFMGSHGKSEHDACLVALTRIRHRYPDLATMNDSEVEASS